VHRVFNNTAGANRLRRGCLDDTCTQVEELEFDLLTAKAGAAQDPEERKEMYWQAEYLLSEVEAAYSPIYYYTQMTMVKPWLHRTFQQLGGQHFDRWTIDWEAKLAATR
jgi:ABC-type oligopeptide transport system substrate-binding subunit